MQAYHSTVQRICKYYKVCENILWDVAPCSLTEIGRCYRGAYCFNHQGDDPDDRDWYIGQYVTHYTAQHRREQASSV